jgi:Metallo-beta-lactamase superfamily
VREVLPGLHHWTAFHQGIRMDVSSYYAAGPRALIDPMLPPDGGFDALAGLPEPEVILLTNRHHHRHSGEFAARFGCPVRCHESGLHEFSEGEQVEGFALGEEVAPGVVALDLAAICPDDSVLLLREQGALAFADGVVHFDEGKLGFVPDRYMDGPEEVKRGVRAKAKRLLQEQEFDALLFAHGAPITSGGREALRAFVECA